MPVIQTNGETIFYEDFGEGPPILFIHSLGTNSYLYRSQIEALKTITDVLPLTAEVMEIAPIMAFLQ